MNAQVIRTEYAELFPVRPWQHAAVVSQGSVTESDDTAAVVAETVAATPRKASDRGASAVEWVVITGIVVAIVAGVGYGISKAISNKADDACNKIAGAGSTAADAGGGNGGTGTTGGNGCAK
ncbi:Flp pilus assembly pilin Flp [Catenulispora sp. GAS73]|uniref:Flp family type IVb pilin n=1 Tax=Catenulispora sp. GAS73 TaxID=3156269 RepID=UPI00351646E2